MRVHDDVTSPIAVSSRTTVDDAAGGEEAGRPEAGRPEAGRPAPGPYGPRITTPRSSTVRTPGAPVTRTASPGAAAAPAGAGIGGQALLVRALLVVLVVGVIASVAVVAAREGHDVAGAPQNQADEVPALQVNPAAIALGTVGQPVGVALPAASALPASAVPGLAPLRPAQPGRTPAASGATSGSAALAGPAGGSLASLAAWARGLATTTGIPARALQAYGLADLAMRRLAPACHLSWVTVAGLARIESNHGRFHGSSVGADGEVSPAIVGVPLDGTNGNTTILDGGGSYAAAMGPLQFIPSTWQRWGVDTHGTGRADANNIDDAAVTAGRYLCAAGGDLSTGPGWRAGVLAYNASDDYARRVYTAAAAYARGGSA